MNKLLLVLTLLGVSAGAFLTARRSTVQLRHGANAEMETWIAQTSIIAVAQAELPNLRAQVRMLEETLTHLPTTHENALWATLQTNRTGHLSPEAREQLLEELGFNWHSSEDFIVVSKEALRATNIRAIRNGKLTEIGAAVLALTSSERGQVEAAIERVRTDFNDWALAHTDRAEPKDDIVAQYTLQRDRAMSLSISNTFASAVVEALGTQRADLVLLYARDFMTGLGIGEEPTTLVIRRYAAGNEQRLKFQQLLGSPPRNNPQPRDLSKVSFPTEFLPVFPNGWADVAKREGFELAQELQEADAP